MRNFLKIDHVDARPLLLTLYQNQQFWKDNTLRQDCKGSPHHDTETIILRFNDISDAEIAPNDRDCIDYPLYDKLPEARSLVMWLMARVQGEQLGRVIIVRLAAGASVDQHKDQLDLAAFYERFHIVLQAMPGVEFYCENEMVEMMPGEVWWFDNSLSHMVMNNSPQDRIHLIVDIKTRGESGVANA